MRALFVAIVVVATASSSFAQIYGARRYTGRIQQQTQKAPPARSNAATQQPAATPQPAPPPAPVQQPQYYPVPQAAAPAKPVDPVKAAAEKAKNEEKQFDFFKRRAEEGSDHAQYELGMRYLSGKGVTADEKLGREWLEKAAKNGNSQAAKKLTELGSEPDKPQHETAVSAASTASKDAEVKVPEAK